VQKDAPPVSVHSLMLEATTALSISKSGKSSSSRAMLRRMSTSEDGSQGSGSAPRSNRVLQRRSSREFQRQMSAVGNRMYAAPEVQQNVVRQVVLDDSCQLPGGLTTSSKHLSVAIDVTKTLSEYVSYYGMLADAHSVGVTIRVMITGVPPDEDIDAACDAQNHLLVKLFQCCAGKDQGRRVRYRPVSSIPHEALRLIKSMTTFDPQKRTSVRTALRYPYVQDVLPTDRVLPSLNEVHYLSFALPRRKTASDTSVPPVNSGARAISIAGGDTVESN
jgi:serine/threonine protein kinase